MKILLVDDNKDRVAKTVGHLVDVCGVLRDDICEESTGRAARALLKNTYFDLLVLDILLPLRSESDPSTQTSVDLLVELSETDNLVKPAHIVGLTAFDEGEMAAMSLFRDRTWTILRTDGLSDDWLRTLSGAVSYLMAQATQTAPADFGVDLVVVTALRMEMDAFQRAWEWSEEVPLDDSSFVSHGSFESGGARRTVVAAVAPRMGMVSASVLTSKLLEKFRPRVVLMPGICAGLPGRVELGDVLLAEMAWDYQSGKFVSQEQAVKGFLLDPHFIQVDQEILARWDQLAKDNAMGSHIVRSWPETVRCSPRLLRGPLASGSAVLADASVSERIVDQQRKTLGVEMEIYGVYSAVESAARPRPLVMGVKSVCDFADEKKADGWQGFAAHASASAGRAFFERYMKDFCP